jgi:hypothetical protein
MRPTLLCLALLACDAEDPVDPVSEDTDPPEATDDTDYAEAADLLTLTTPVPGDTTCFDPAGTWGAQTADPSCVVQVPVTGDIEDFESGDGVAGATIELFWDDTVGDAPDATLTSDAAGLVSGGDAKSCSPFTARIATDPLHEETKLTVQQHWTEGPGDPMDTFFNSVAGSTYLLIPAILGVRPDATRGIVAGTAYDCGGEGVPVSNIQVLVKDSTGAYPTAVRVHYFVDEFPMGVATETSADGLWMALNVPPGRVTLEMWGLVDGEPQLLGQTGADVLPDGITITDLYLGDDDGVKLDAACLSPCGM